MKNVEITVGKTYSEKAKKNIWSSILRYKLSNGRYAKGELPSSDEKTLNRKKLMLLISSLEKLKEPCNLTITTDSWYIINCISKKWAEKWRRNGWKRPNGQQAKNADLWSKLLSLISAHDCKFVKI